MTFFNWSAADGEQIVSPYLWIYPVLTVTITAIVIACWYFFIRRRRAQASDTGWVDKEQV
jgi:heme/copper-type cytochrome/quinol oxidase subunit 2